MKNSKLNANNVEIKITRNGEIKTLVLREFRVEDVERIYKSWSNPQNYRYNEITWNIDDVMEMVSYPSPTSWGMFYKVAEIKETGEIVATCRFGTRYDTKPEDMIWDFGYNVFRSDDKETYTIADIKNAFENGVTRDSFWGKGYGQAMLSAIIAIANEAGVKKLIAGADSRNFASQKVMIKNGFTFDCIDEDYDVELCLDLTKPQVLPSKEDISKTWAEHEKFVNNHIKKNKRIIEMADKKHFSDAIFYLLLNRTLKINKLQKNENSNNEISQLENEITNIIKDLTDDECLLLRRRINSRIKTWKDRFKAQNFNNIELFQKLELCKMLKQILLKFNLIDKCELKI